MPSFLLEPVFEIALSELQNKSTNQPLTSIY